MLANGITDVQDGLTFKCFNTLPLLSVHKAIQGSHSLNDAINIFSAAILLKVISDLDKNLIFN